MVRVDRPSQKLKMLWRHRGGKKAIILARTDYVETLSEPLLIKKGIHLLGGFDENFVVDDEAQTRFSLEQGVEAVGINRYTLLTNLEFLPSENTPNSTGSFSVMLKVVDSPTLVIEKSRVKSRDGAKGADGKNGKKGADGGDGKSGGYSGMEAVSRNSCISATYGGNPGVNWACPLASGSRGGASGGKKGGVCQANGRSGEETRERITGGHAGYWDQSPWEDSTAPGRGHTGFSNESLVTEAGRDGLKMGLQGESGSDGDEGIDGQGGSGGGAGGCGGHAGKGGEGGDGGKGGIGGNGGGHSEPECNRVKLTGARGAQGGEGSKGGKGGSGAGGSSIGIYCENTILESSNLKFELGIGGTNLGNGQVNASVEMVDCQ